MLTLTDLFHVELFTSPHKGCFGTVMKQKIAYLMKQVVWLVIGLGLQLGRNA